MANWLEKLRKRSEKANKGQWWSLSLLRQVQQGTFFRLPNGSYTKTLADIETTIQIMRGLATDAQIATALDYYATDATTPNTTGDIIWATAIDPDHKDIADIINAKLKQWDVNKYARDHILEIATVGNLYIPTTDLYKQEASYQDGKKLYALDKNTIRDDAYELVCSYKIPPEDILHIWHQGRPDGFILQPDGDNTTVTKYPEDSIIHFALGGLLGDYSLEARDADGNPIVYDVQFADPLLLKAVQPTQTLSLLEDSTILSSLSRLVKFINVECGNAEEEEIQATLQQIKDMLEQQLAINTATGNTQSFVNPQSPNNLIYLPRINGQDAISVTDLDMAQAQEADNNLLDYYQNKKLSVLGIPKEALNYSGAEGLGQAGSVMSQRSALYANILGRLETAYKEGWRTAINHYLIRHNLEGMVDQYTLNMNPIVTELSSLNFEKRDAALGQATAIVELLKSLGVDGADEYKKALVEILSEVFPTTGQDVNGWQLDLSAGAEGGGEGGF